MHPPLWSSGPHLRKRLLPGGLFGCFGQGLFQVDDHDLAAGQELHAELVRIDDSDFDSATRILLFFGNRRDPRPAPRESPVNTSWSGESVAPATARSELHK